MRLPGTPHECGPLMELGWITRQLRLGSPVPAGVETIAVESIVGTIDRGRDFDACWHPLNPRMAKRLDEVEAAQPATLDEPITVVGVDRAYFVQDGHKRVALARRTGREFLDANVSRTPTSYELTDDLDEEAITRTAREGEFRSHSGLSEAVPEARFALTEIDAYGELFRAVQAHAHELSERHGRLLPASETARTWYADDYLPTVRSARESIGGLLESATDADVYLAVYRQRVAWWGSECDDPDCEATLKLAHDRIEASRQGSLVSTLLGRGSRAPREARVLPLTHSTPDA